MAVGQYEARVDDAWIATAPNGSAEDEIRPGSQIWIRVNAQAGNAIMNDGAAYRLVVRLLNITANYTFIPLPPATSVITGNLGDAKWPVADNTFNVPIPAINPPLPQDTLLRVQVVLTSGASQRGVNVFEGDVCVVTA